MEMRFEWDPTKADLNIKKHRVSFELALRVFADPFALSIQDRFEDGEERWQTIGMVDGIVLLLVAHTVREEQDSGTPIDVIRIISARKADRHERHRYEQEHR